MPNKEPEILVSSPFINFTEYYYHIVVVIIIHLIIKTKKTWLHRFLTFLEK